MLLVPKATFPITVTLAGGVPGTGPVNDPIVTVTAACPDETVTPDPKLMLALSVTVVSSFSMRMVPVLAVTFELKLMLEPPLVALASIEMALVALMPFVPLTVMPPAVVVMPTLPLPVAGTPVPEPAVTEVITSACWLVPVPRFASASVTYTLPLLVVFAAAAAVKLS